MVEIQAGQLFVMGAAQLIELFEMNVGIYFEMETGELFEIDLDSSLRW